MNSSSQPLVSIITPLYNNADYLAECIESVLAQTYQNWDYTIVNNCSTDGSGEVARRYAAKDKRIRIHDNEEFLRAIPNHNHSLRQISPASKYCKIVFADDWIFPECVEQMVAVAEENPSVGLVGACSLQGQEVMWAGLPYPSRRVSGREVCRKHFLENLYVFGPATCVLYRADLVRRHDPFYNEANIHADTESCFMLLKESDFGFVHQVLAFTRMRPVSLTAMSNNIQTSFAGMLHNALTHGPDFLTREEVKAYVDRHLTDYYEFLGKSLIRGRDNVFWDYHKRKLIEAGVGFSRSRLAGAAVRMLLKSALNPKEAVEKLVKRRNIAILVHEEETR